MPELPEVQTTVTGLSKTIVGLKIIDAWSDYNSAFFKGSDTIKDPAYFKKLRREVVGKRIESVTRRAKNILIHLSSGSTLLIHMKMTGHVLIGKYHLNVGKKKDPWEPLEPEALKDPFNRHVHFVLTLSGARGTKHLALSDVRKFAKIGRAHV